jgi:hypothetical protein
MEKSMKADEPLCETYENPMQTYVTLSKPNENLWETYENPMKTYENQ